MPSVEELAPHEQERASLDGEDVERNTIFTQLIDNAPQYMEQEVHPARQGKRRAVNDKTIRPVVNDELGPLSEAFQTWALPKRSPAASCPAMAMVTSKGKLLTDSGRATPRLLKPDPLVAWAWRFKMRERSEQSKRSSWDAPSRGDATAAAAAAVMDSAADACDTEEIVDTPANDQQHRASLLHRWLASPLHYYHYARSLTPRARRAQRAAVTSAEVFLRQLAHQYGPLVLANFVEVQEYLDGPGPSNKLARLVDESLPSLALADDMGTAKSLGEHNERVELVWSRLRQVHSMWLEGTLGCYAKRMQWRLECDYAHEAGKIDSAKYTDPVEADAAVIVGPGVKRLMCKKKTYDLARKVGLGGSVSK